jgi:MSHA biogenesis protein MshQ
MHRTLVFQAQQKLKQERPLRRWLVLLALFFGMCVGCQVQAQTYAYRADTFAYDTPSGTATSVVWHATSPTPACTQYPNGDDDWADVAFPSGFTFRFGGVSYSSVRVYSNGMLAFPTDVSGFHRDYSSQALPITAAPGAYTGCVNAVPKNLMVAYWLDIVAGSANGTSGASVKYELLGAAPARRFVISWDNVKLYNTATRYNFQVVLQESAVGVNGNFKYQYTNGSSTGAGATVGVQLTTTDYTQYAHNQNFIDTTFGTSILWYPANQLAAKGAEYRFDEGSWSGASGEIKDTSGNTQHATLASTNVANVVGGKLCRGATFTNNTSNATRDAIATPITPANQGSVSFWYKSNSAWNASDAMLLDATTVAARPFFLLKRSTGALRFSVTDSAGTVITANTSTAYNFAASTWHHIAVSWSLKAGTNQTVLQIMVDGVLANTGTTPYRSTSNGIIATLSTLYIGDNRTSGVTPSGGSPNGANGTLDEIYVYALDINATQAAADMALLRPSCTSTLNHFHITHGGAVVNCGGAVASVTVEAHDASHGPVSLSGTTLTMTSSSTTSPFTAQGTWTSVSTINPVTGTAGSGVGGYIFSNESSVIFGLSQAVSGTVNINLNSGGITESSGTASACVAADHTFGTTCDADLSFAQAGLSFDVPNHVAETTQSLTIKAVKKSDSSDACVPLFASTSKDLTFTCSYTNPTTGTLPVRVGGNALNTGNNVATQCDATGQVVNLAFDVSGVATTPLLYADVGDVILNAEYTAAGITMTGTDTFISAPAGFAFSAIPSAPLTAGNAFNVTVTAMNGGVAPAATPNFGKETAAATVALSSTNPLPALGNATAISSTLSGFTAGAASTNLTWNEVGTFDLVASTSTYLGSALSPSSTQSDVGRFIPAYFDTVVTQGCSTFTYAGWGGQVGPPALPVQPGQPFTATVTAWATGGTITKNYAGATWAMPVTLGQSTAVAGTLTSASIAAASFVDGVGTASPTFRFTNSPTIPSSIAIHALDTDGVASIAAAVGPPVVAGTEGTVPLRSGRVRVFNAYGSELLALPVSTVFQYYASAASGWVTGTDTCTALAAGNFAFSFPVNAANKLAACETVVTVAGANPRPTVTLSAPGAGNNGWADLTLNLGATAAGNQCTAVGGAATTANAPWLQFNWLGAGVANPTSQVTFGVYKSPLIYRRENY